MGGPRPEQKRSIKLWIALGYYDSLGMVERVAGKMRSKQG
jgi:hypothetical protein